MEETDITKDTLVTPDEVVKPKRRRRRTKAEIEADKASKEVDKFESLNHKSEVEDNGPVVGSTGDEAGVVESKGVVEASRLKTDADSSNVEVASDEFVSSEPSVPSNPDEKVKTLDSSPSYKAKDTLGKQIVGYFNVYEKPVHGAHVRRLYKVAETLCIMDDFVQIQYLRQGYGLVKGYVLIEDLQRYFDHEASR